MRNRWSLCRPNEMRSILSDAPRATPARLSKKLSTLLTRSPFQGWSGFLVALKNFLASSHIGVNASWKHEVYISWFSKMGRNTSARRRPGRISETMDELRS